MLFNIPRSLPVIACAFLAGICLTTLVPNIPNYSWLLASLVGFIILISLKTNHLIYIIGVVSLGFGLMTLHITLHQAHTIPLILETKKIAVIGTISSVVEDSKNHKSKFSFVVRKVDNQGKDWKLPAIIQLSWNNPLQTLQPGDSWQLTVKIKRPRNYANPGSFDTEKYFFQQRIVGLGYVVEAAQNRLLQSNSFYNPINSLRQYMLRVMRACMPDHDFGNVIVSLVLGIKGDIPQEHLEVLQNTGTAHLMAISGLHIGLLASMCFLLFRVSWRYVPVSWLFIPAPWLAAVGALAVSVSYALLAGFSIATQRSLIMVTVFLAGILLKRKLSTTYSFCLALLLVLLWDPFAILSIGFWFSFLAVGFLIYAMRGRSRHWLRPQMAIALALLPLNLLFFGKNSLIGPIANTIAIPWVGFAVLPISLLAVILLPIFPEISSVLWKIAAQNFAYLWPLLSKLSQLPTYNWQMPILHLSFIMGAALLGAIWLFMPRGLPGRWWGIVGFIPIFFVHGPLIPFGQAEFTLLDVGQGLSAVIRTTQHVLVYDTGAKLNENFDLGSRVVVPYLQAVGVKKIDTLMISHGDNDHVGGAYGILRRFKAQNIITSTDQPLPDLKPIICTAGQQWQWDGVTFTVLHPSVEMINKKRNDQSCVLMVQAGDHKVLLTGDIEKRAEKQLIARYGEDLHADVLLVPHHGSKTSSSWEFLRAVQPKYALIPVGYKNQYGHPKEQVLQRYSDLDIEILRTELDGAISFTLGGDMLPNCYRRAQQGFWLQ